MKKTDILEIKINTTEDITMIIVIDNWVMELEIKNPKIAEAFIIIRHKNKKTVVKFIQ